MDVSIRIPQIEREMFSQRLHRRFGRVVRRVARRIRDTLLAACDDDRGGCVGRARLEGGNVGVQAIYHTEEVRVKDLGFVSVSFALPHTNGQVRPQQSMGVCVCGQHT